MTRPPSAVSHPDVALPAECREPLRDLLIACADTKLLMGYHYGEWTFGTPMIEAAVAHCSLAQGELGHVRLLHGILKAHFDVDPDYLVEQRPAEQFAANPYLDEALQDWPAVIAMTVVVDQSVTRVIHALRDSSFTPLRSCAAKLLDEERYHLHHGQGWLRTLAQDESERGTLEAALGRALSATLFWLRPETRADQALVAARVMDRSGAAIAQDLMKELGALAQSLGLDLPKIDEEWQDSAPSDEVLYHLRGTKNAVFKQA
jgi:ring-1,2-phenylacetyl-CoA epoxidase subunit PaaC